MTKNHHFAHFVDFAQFLHAGPLRIALCARISRNYTLGTGREAGITVKDSPEQASLWLTLTRIVRIDQNRYFHQGSSETPHSEKATGSTDSYGD